METNNDVVNQEQKAIPKWKQEQQYYKTLCKIRNYAASKMPKKEEGRIVEMCDRYYRVTNTGAWVLHRMK